MNLVEAAPVNKWDIVGFYTGEAIRIDAGKKVDEQYLFQLSVGEKGDQLSSFGVNAKNKGSHTRFFNHSREDSNLTVSRYIAQDGKPYVIFRASKPILKSEELCYDYGEDYPFETYGFKR